MMADCWISAAHGRADLLAADDLELRLRKLLGAAPVPPLSAEPLEVVTRSVSVPPLTSF